MRSDRCRVGADALVAAFALGALSAVMGPTLDYTIAGVAALRVLGGQQLYVDFSIPHGPVTTMLFVPLVAFAPSMGWALVLASGALNACAAALAGGIVGRVSESRETPRNAALLTALWFLPPFGAYYHDQLAYAFVLAAGLAYLSRLAPLARAALTGSLLALAYHAKQPVGLAGAAALVVAVALVDRRRALADPANRAALLFYCLAHGLVLLAITWTGDLGHYVRDAVELPVDYARRRAHEKAPWAVLRATVLPFGIDPWEMVRERGIGRLAFYPIVMSIYLSYGLIARSYLRWRRAPDEAGASRLLAAVFLALSTVWCSAPLSRLFAEVTFGAGALLALVLEGVRFRMRQVVLASCAMIALVHVLWLREAVTPFDPFFFSTNVRPLLVRDLGHRLDLDGLRGVVQFLKDKPGALALLAEGSAQLVPLALGRPTFEPVAFYVRDLTVPSNPERRRRWEADFVTTLERRRVEFVISTPFADPVTFLDIREGPDRILDRFVVANFEPVYTGGRYLVLRRKPRGPDGA